MAEDLLNSAHIECDLVPVPREISSECGLAMVLTGSNIQTALEIINVSDAQVVARYNVNNGKYVKEDKTGNE